jgi:hypothetical protein
MTSAPLGEATDNALVTQAIIDANEKQLAQSRPVCERLLASLGCKLTNQSICRIILAGDDSIPATERLNLAKRESTTFNLIYKDPD